MRSNHARVRIAINLYLLCLVAVNVSVWGWFVVHRHTPGHHFPLGERIERFGDLLRFSGKFQYGKDHRIVDGEHLIGTLFPKNYPPFAATIYLFLLQVCAPYALAVFLAAIFAGFGAASFLLWCKVRSLPGYAWPAGASIFLTGLFGWGTLQVAMRGNIEGFMWIAVWIGAALYAQRRYNGAGAAFGVACCLKPYPVLWFGLMARYGKFRGIVVGLLTSAAVTLASLEVINVNPLRAYRQLRAKDTFFTNYVVAFRPMPEMTGDHSLLQTMKTIARVVRNRGLAFGPWDYHHHPSYPLAWTLYHASLPLAAAIGLVTLWLVWNKPVLNQIFALATVTTLLPPVSGDYTLTILLIPMGFFLIVLLEDVAQGKTPMSMFQMLWFLLPCAWIMACDPIWVLHGPLKTLALTVLLAASVAVPVPSTLFGEVAPEKANTVHEMMLHAA